jgi:hypothetical protein
LIGLPTSYFAGADDVETGLLFIAENVVPVFVGRSPAEACINNTIPGCWSCSLIRVKSAGSPREVMDNP